MRPTPIVCLCLLLVACGGGTGERAQRAATACDHAARDRLEGKSYQIDAEALAKSMQDKPDGTQLLTATVTVEPGLASETKQVMECSVRFVEGKAEPDVIGFVFNW